MELNVAIASQYNNSTPDVKGYYLHKGVGYRHSCDDHNVHKERDGDHTLVEADKSIVLSKAIANEICLDGLQKVPIECGINDEIQELLNAVPVLVDDMVPVVDLEARWDPDVEDTNVDRSNENGSGYHDLPRAPAVRHNDTDTIDDDLQQQLNLYAPPEEDCEVENKA
jgi:hypothetical protein